MARVQVGTTGWSHADWVGPFYPVHLRARPEAWLSHYATRFRAVEIASTFDRFPDEDLVSSWARAGVTLQERGPFEFSLKLPRVVTHEALLSGDIDAAREWTGRFDREVLDPLEGEGLLGVVLVQLPSAYPATEERGKALVEALTPLAERRVAIEVRSAAWNAGGVVPFLDRLFATGDVALVEADLPGGVDVRAPVAARHAYLRFHGRRAEGWGEPPAANGASRYDHLYARDDLAPWVERIREHERAGREVRAFFNNAPRAQAVANAVDLKEMLGAPAPLPRPKLTAQQRLPF